MKKLTLGLLLSFSLLTFGQDLSPLPSITVKKLIAPNNPVFYYNTADSALWVFKGETGWLRIASNSQLIRYYVPYDNALRNVNLGDKRISSTKQRLPLFNGACQIPTILDNGDGSISVGDGEYHVSTNVEGRGSENFVITGGTFTLTNNTTNYLVADYNSGTPILRVTTDVNEINETTIVPVYTAYRNGNYLHFQNWDALGVALANKVHQSIVKTQRYRRESGLALSEYPTRYLALSSGRVWTGAVPVSVSAIATSTDNLFLYYHSGGVWTSTVTTQYNNTQYDNGTNLVTLTANRYAVNWIFRGIESQKHLYVILGTGDYTLAQAQEAVLPAAPTAITSHAMLVGKLIVQNGATTATAIQSAFDTQFSTATPNAHNDLTGRDATDVHPASSVTNMPSGTITATTVQAAINYLDGKDVNTVSVTGTDTKIITITLNNGSTKTATFTSGGITIPNGTGFLKNGGSYNWSYDNSTYDNYGGWFVYHDGSIGDPVTSNTGVDWRAGDGISLDYTGIYAQPRLTYNLNLAGLTTIVNPTTSYYIPTTGGSSNTKITISTLESILGTTTGDASRLAKRDASSDLYAHNFILSSDFNLKKNIKPLQNTDWTNEIDFKQFQFKDDPKKKVRFGVIAQDIEKLAPDLVSTDEQGNKAVAYIDLLIAKIAEMDKRIKELEYKLKEVTTR